MHTILVNILLVEYLFPYRKVQMWELLLKIVAVKTRHYQPLSLL